MSFINLHVHDEFSQLDGFGTAKAYAERAKFLNQTALASTNHGNIDGLIKHQKACEESGIKPILGCELYVVPNPLIKQKGERRCHMVVLVRNWAGWTALCTLLSRANLEGFYYRPRVGIEWFKELTDEQLDGLVIGSACLGSYLKLSEGKALFDWFCGKKVSLFLEVQSWPHQDQIEWNKQLEMLSRESYVPLVATNDSHYILPEDAKAQEVLLAIQRKQKWSDPDRFRFEFEGLHLRSEREMVRAFHRHGSLSEKVYREAIEKTVEIADLCDFTIPKMDINLPVTRYEKDISPDKALWRLIQAGVEKRFNSINLPNCNDRIEEEFKVITDKKFERYFLMVYEFVNFCRENNIPVGPGRGSVGGSLIAYLLHITDVNPLDYGLLFSRFINPERNDFPDIDIDVASHLRDETRLHLEREYGLNHIAGISTFTKMKARTVIRDVARVFDVPLREVDVFAKSLPQSAEKVKNAIEEAKKTREGQAFSKKYPEVIDIASRLEGQVRASGQHPAAIIVSADDLTCTGRGVVVERDGTRVINWDMDDSEYIGLMKLDDLRLDTLSIIGLALELIDDKGIDLVGLSMDDPEVFQMLSQGRTCGVFQLAGYACKKLCVEMGVDSFDDIAAITSLARPGPMNSGMTPEYVARKHGALWEKSRHPQYHSIVENTYGVLVYQEQVMKVFMDVAGMSAGQADKIRKVIGKKRDAAEFEPHKIEFIEGCRAMNTFNKKEALEFWEGLINWASYGFNLSHAVEYSMISYWTAWLKRYYPKEYIAAFLTYGEKSQKSEMIQEAMQYCSLRLVTPKVGISDPEKWMVKDDCLVMPFGAVKGIGPADAAKCNQQRPPGGGSGLGAFFKVQNTNPEKKGTALQLLLDNIKAFDKDMEAKPDDMQKYFDCLNADMECLVESQQQVPQDYIPKRSEAVVVPRRNNFKGRVAAVKPSMSLGRSLAYVKIHKKQIEDQAFLGSVPAQDILEGLKNGPEHFPDDFCRAVECWLQRDDDIPF